MYRISLNTEIAEPEVVEKQALQIDASVEEERQVILHCFMHMPQGGGVRIWKSTYLMDKQSAHRSKLVNAFGISIAPVWTLVEVGQTVHFTLTFERLPSTCVIFDLIEDIPEEGGFFVGNIVRNREDVYKVRL